MGLEALLTLLRRILLAIRPSEDVLALAISHIIFLGSILAGRLCRKVVKVPIRRSRYAFRHLTLYNLLHV